MAKGWITISQGRNSVSQQTYTEMPNFINEDRNVSKKTTKKKPQQFDSTSPQLECYYQKEDKRQARKGVSHTLLVAV